jgi:hypothetical protein
MLLQLFITEHAKLYIVKAKHESRVLMVTCSGMFSGKKNMRVADNSRLIWDDFLTTFQQVINYGDA